MSRQTQNPSRLARIRLASLLILLGFLISAAFHYVSASYGGRSWPQSTYLYNPAEQFYDFKLVHLQTMGLNPYEEKPGCPECRVSSYFPFAHLLVYPLTWTTWGKALALYFALFAGSLAFFAWAWLKMPSGIETARNAAIILLLNYPVQFMLDRGNFEGLVFIALAGFAVLFSKKQYGLSAIALGIAIAQKGYPAVYLLAFVGRRRVAPILWAGGVALALTFLSFLAMKGSLPQNLTRLREAQHSMNLLSTEPAGNPYRYNMVRYSTSFFALVKLIALDAFPRLATRPKLELILGRYSLVVAATAALVTLYVALGSRRFALWELLFISTAVGQLFPHVSFDYKLIHFLIPFALFVNSSLPERRSLFHTVAFSILLVPKGYFLVSGEVPISTLVNPWVIVVMVFEILVRGGESQERSVRKGDAIPEALTVVEEG